MWEEVFPIPSGAYMIFDKDSSSVQLASMKACQHFFFPFPAKQPVISASVKAWNAGRAAVLSGPSVCTIGASGMVL